MKVGALVLAAGMSRRMGAAKLALPIDGAPLVARTLQAVKRAGLPALVVTGGHEDAVLAAIGNTPTVHADRYAEGLAESLKAGLTAAPADWGALLVILADMPFVQPETLTALADALRNGANAAVPVQANKRGNPAGFARSTWPRLMNLTGDQGARPLLDALNVTEIPVEDRGIHQDIDRPEDLPSQI